MSYETLKFDTIDGNLVRNSMACFQSDEGAWERLLGLRALWNGVDMSPVNMIGQRHEDNIKNDSIQSHSQRVGCYHVKRCCQGHGHVLRTNKQ